jgi:4-diphosphocytidyl-2-C-methyl-D-erythritol kinase
LGQAGGMPTRPGDIERLLAPAKLTTRLRVTGARRDGYHLLDSEMITVDLYDELEIGPGDDLRVTEEIDWLAAAGAQVPPAQGEANGPNLVEVALRAVGRKASVHLTKRIPTGAGLGGGSADAAAILRWAGNRDPQVAARIGADVPFCVVGGRAAVSGVGEVVEPLRPIEASYLVVVPGLHVSTPAVYSAWDSLGGPEGDNGNDLEPAALAVEPRLAWWRDLVEGATGARPALAGSGGTWWLAGDRPRLEELADVLKSAIIGSGEPALVRVVGSIRGNWSG